MSEERFKRDDPQRTEPVRDASNVFQGSAPWGATAAADVDPWAGATGAGTEAPDWLGSDVWSDSQDYVNQGVRKGYALLREQMERGQQYAEQVRGGFGGFGGSGGSGGSGGMPDLRSLFEQTLYFYSDAMLRWCEPFLPPRPQGSSTASSMPVTVTSSRPTRASLRLFPGAQTPFDAWPLYARDRAKPPLLDVRFVVHPGGGAALAVRVPDDQPADLYLGVITNRSTGQPAGVVSVEIAVQSR